MMEKRENLQYIEAKLKRLADTPEEELLELSNLEIQREFIQNDYDYCKLLMPNGELMDDPIRARHGLDILLRNKDGIIASDTREGRTFLVNTIEFLLASLSDS